MRTIGCLAVAAAALLVAAPAARSGDEDAAARAVLAKALKAHGGADNVAKTKAVHLKASGTITVGNETFDITADWHTQGLTQMKAVIDVNFNGMMIKLTKVLNGDKGWNKLGDAKATPLTKEEIAEDKDLLYARHLQTLAPLTDKAFKLSPLGEIKVNDKDAYGITAKYKGQKDVNLFFDKQKHLLVKIEQSVQDQGQEVLQEMYFSAYKLVDGLQQAHKLSIKRNNAKFVEVEITEIRAHTERLDDSVFIEP